MYSVTNAVDLLSDSVSVPMQKKRRSNNDFVTPLTLTHDLVKANVAADLINVNNGIHIFPFTLSGSAFSLSIMQFFDTIMGVSTTEQLSTLWIAVSMSVEVHLSSFPI